MSYSIGPDELLVLKHEGGVSTARRVSGVERLLDQVRFFATRTAVAQATFEETALARTLYDVLLGPELATAGGSRLLIVPDGVLFDLPFAALIDASGRFLAERHVISVAPSLGTLSTIASVSGATGQSRSMLAVAATTFEGTLPNGNPLPDLPSAAREARAIAALSRGADVRTNVTEQSFKATALDDYPVLHLATHIVADAARPDRSAIILGSGGEDDGLLQAREIYGLSLPLRLAVISGCSSGRGQVVAGEGVLGLSHALFSAGARALVLSLWEVGDRATARLMQDFYTALRDRADRRGAGRGTADGDRRSGAAAPRLLGRVLRVRQRRWYDRPAPTRAVGLDHRDRGQHVPGVADPRPPRLVAIPERSRAWPFRHWARSSRSPLSVTITVAPVSASTAIHSGATPNGAAARNATFVSSAIATFCRITRNARRACASEKLPTTSSVGRGRARRRRSASGAPRARPRGALERGAALDRARRGAPRT